MISPRRAMYGAPLPVEIDFKLTPPAERPAFLQKANPADRQAIWKTLTQDDRTKRHAEAFPDELIGVGV